MLQHLQTVYTDTYNVSCPHSCEVPLRVEVIRERGGKVLDIKVLHVHIERLTDNSKK